jgi:hypothetical protein
MYPDAPREEGAENISPPVLLLLGVGDAVQCGSEGGPVTLPVFKTGDWHLAMSMVRSTRTRFRQYFARL